MRLKREKERELEKKGKLDEKLRKEKLRKEKSKARRKQVFNFFHGLGLVKTEEEKSNIRKRQERRKRQKELDNKRMEDEKIRLEEERKRGEIEKQKEKELEIKRKREEERKKQKETEKQQRDAEKRKQKELELKKKEDEKRIKENAQKSKISGTHFVGKQIKEIPKKKAFLGLFGKKKVDMELEKELKEIEEVTPKPVKKNVEEEKLELPELEEIAPKIIKKKIKEEKIEVPELDEIEKEMKKPDLASAEEEIQKAIQGMKVKKRPSFVKRLFKKKEKVKEKIETPEVMPRTYDKIDYVESIEEKIHKARLSLMDFKFDEAKRIYIEIMKMYNDLEPKNKARVYQDIKDLYYERKSAEKFAK